MEFYTGDYTKGLIIGFIGSMSFRLTRNIDCMGP